MLAGENNAPGYHFPRPKLRSVAEITAERVLLPLPTGRRNGGAEWWNAAKRIGPHLVMSHTSPRILRRGWFLSTCRPTGTSGRVGDHAERFVIFRPHRGSE